MASVSVLAVSTTLAAQPAQHYKQTNLVADTAGVAATTDPNLVNPWGMSRSSGSPWWISDNTSGLTTLYSGAGTSFGSGFTVPTGNAWDSALGSPTGQVFNGTTDFQLSPGNPAHFIFVTEDGTISAWNPTVNPEPAIKYPSKLPATGASVFKGVALATAHSASGGTANYLYVADFRKGRVAVFDGSFQRVRMDDDAFTDEAIPYGFAPFNVQNIGGDLYVAFAEQDGAKHDEVDGPGLGYVDVFSTSGRLLRRLQHGEWFNGPWGITQAPGDFGVYSHDILVGNFGSGWILAFDPVTGRFKGPLYGTNNAPIAIEGLWDIAFGGGTTSGSATSLFFTAGPGGEQHGLFGMLTPVENALGGDQ
jgi:uncharacterized protein (TIGR03118 family)